MRGAIAVMPTVILQGNNAPKVKVTETPQENPITVKLEFTLLN